MTIFRESNGPLEASIFVEALRAAPGLFLGAGLIAHALLWAIASHFAETAPAQQMAVALSLGSEWLLGYADLPPLSAWISEAIFRATHSLFAIRLAAALCVAAAGWFVFLLARRIVGDRQGAIAVLVMVSVFPVAFPGSALTGELLQMPLAAIAVLAWWIAVAERNPNGWIALGAALGAMIYAGPQAIALLAALMIATLASSRARASIFRFDAALCIALAIFILIFVAGPRLIWLHQNGWGNLFAGSGAGLLPNETVSPLRLLASIVTGHFGFALLLFLATAYAAKARENAPVFVREPAIQGSRRTAMIVAILPALIALVALYLLARHARPQFFAPLLMFGGLAAVLMAGERLIVRRQVLVGSIALIFFFVPPVIALFSSFVPGWIGDNRPTNWPAASAARTLTDIYRTRTGRPLEFIVGERVQAAQVAALSGDRPHLFVDGDPALSPWIDHAEFKKKGGVVFWEVHGADAAPPADYMKRLPAFVAEAPLRLPWARGGGDPVRLGWAIVPPQGE